MTPVTEKDIFTYIYKIQLNFDNSYQTSSENERLLLIASWYEILREYPKEVCDLAVTNALRRAKFAPRIGDIVEEAERIIHATDKSDEQLWAELMQVLPSAYEISRYLRYPQYFKNAAKKLNDMYAALSPDLRLYVVNVSTLIELSELTSDSLSYEKNRFFRQMPTLRAQNAQTYNADRLLKNIEKQNKIGIKNE